jgi:Zn-finger nucleic acid-binding protein
MKIVRGGEYFFCEYCSSFYFPQESRDGVRILGEPSGFLCPVCREELVSAAIIGIGMLCCRRCRGVLIKQDAFRVAVEYSRASASGPADLPKPLSKQEGKRTIKCPGCGRQMDTHPYYGPGNVIIDVCTDCREIWLDYGELARIINAPGRDRKKPREG